MDKKLIKLIIPAAGMGTRLLPITRTTPKEMLRLVDRPIAEYLVEEAYRSGIREIIFIVNPWKRAVMNDYFADSDGASRLKEFPDAHFAFLETSDQFGDGHAILLARGMVGEHEAFAVTMGDLLCPPEKPFLAELRNVFEKFGAPVIAVEQVLREHVDRYGVIAPKSSEGKLHVVGGIVEKPSIASAPSNFIMIGKYILEPEIFAYLEHLRSERTPGKEIKLADALNLYARDHKLFAFECSEKHFDTGNKLGLLRTEVSFALKRQEFKEEFGEFLESIR